VGDVVAEFPQDLPFGLVERAWAVREDPEEPVQLRPVDQRDDGVRPEAVLGGQTATGLTRGFDLEVFGDGDLALVKGLPPGCPPSGRPLGDGEPEAFERRLARPGPRSGLDRRRLGIDAHDDREPVRVGAGQDLTDPSLDLASRGLSDERLVDLVDECADSLEAPRPLPVVVLLDSVVDPVRE